MADTKITGLTADASPSTDDLIITVNNPGGAAANRKVTIANLITAVMANTDAESLGITDTGANYTATTVEAALAEVIDTRLAANIAIADTGTNFVATHVENALAELFDAGPTAATGISVADTGTNFVATHVENALAELFDGRTALLTSIADTGAHFAAANVENALNELASGSTITSLTLASDTGTDGTESLVMSTDERMTLAGISRFTNRVLAEFGPYDNTPPTANFATLDTRNNHPVLDFDATTNESAVFSGRLGTQYTSNGATVDIHYSMTSAVALTVDWDVSFERIGDSVLDIDADSFGNVNSVDNTTVPGTSGHVDVVSIVLEDTGNDLAGLNAGEQFRLKVTRDAASDDATGDAELHRVVVRETLT